MKPTPTMFGLLVAASGNLDLFLQHKGEYFNELMKFRRFFNTKPNEELGSKTVDLRLNFEPDDVVL